jgi:hypothetical protein
MSAFVKRLVGGISAFAVDGFVAEILCLLDTNDRFFRINCMILAILRRRKLPLEFFPRVFLPNHHTLLPLLLTFLTDAINRVFGRHNRAPSCQISVCHVKIVCPALPLFVSPDIGVEMVSKGSTGYIRRLYSLLRGFESPRPFNEIPCSDVLKNGPSGHAGHFRW